MIKDAQVSVVVPIRKACETASTTVTELLKQCELNEAELIVVVSELDATRPQLELLKHPRLRLLVRPGFQAIPQLRRDGVRAARARWVVITEDHCRFPPAWLSDVITVQNSVGRGVVGGPVDNGRRTLVGWAQYFTRYTAFMGPMEAGPARALSGSSACYPRELLDQYSCELKDGFWEAEFNATLLNHNEQLWMFPKLAVEAHQSRGFFEYILLRYRHGRSYGARRFENANPRQQRRLLLSIAVIPVVLYGRAARLAFQKGRCLALLLASLLLIPYLCAWSLGEAIGYLFGPANKPLDTD